MAQGGIGPGLLACRADTPEAQLLVQALWKLILCLCLSPSPGSQLAPHPEHQVMLAGTCHLLGRDWMTSDKPVAGLDQSGRRRCK